MNFGGMSNGMHPQFVRQPDDLKFTDATMPNWYC